MVLGVVVSLLLFVESEVCLASVTAGCVDASEVGYDGS